MLHCFKFNYSYALCDTSSSSSRLLWTPCAKTTTWKPCCISLRHVRVCVWHVCVSVCVCSACVFTFNIASGSKYLINHIVSFFRFSPFSAKFYQIPVCLGFCSSRLVWLAVSVYVCMCVCVCWFSTNSWQLFFHKFYIKYWLSFQRQPRVCVWVMKVTTWFGISLEAHHCHAHSASINCVCIAIYLLILLQQTQEWKASTETWFAITCSAIETGRSRQKTYPAIPSSLKTIPPHIYANLLYYMLLNLRSIQYNEDIVSSFFAWSWVASTLSGTLSG